MQPKASMLGAIASLALVANANGADTGSVKGQVATHAGDAARGEALYARRCGACHSLDQNRIGPKHRNVFGAKAGSVADFRYSKALKTLDVTWNEASLDQWLQDPTKMAPGTMMGFRLTNPQERADIIAYLRANSELAAAKTDE